MTIMLTIAGLYAFVFVCWLLYLAIMNLAAHKDRMGPVAKVHAYAALFFGYLFDFVLNMIACLAFQRVPRDWLLTGTLKRMIINEEGWRCAVAAWICQNLLNPFDPKGAHC
jgi:hypothetical protein